LHSLTDKVLGRIEFTAESGKIEPDLTRIFAEPTAGVETFRNAELTKRDLSTRSPPGKSIKAVCSVNRRAARDHKAGVARNWMTSL
jgi:hypothetical protein